MRPHTRRRTAATVVAALLGALGLATGHAQAYVGTGPPTTYGGAKATLYAGGMKNPTSFAWGDGAMFAGDSGSTETPSNGGVYIVKPGVTTEIPDGPVFVGGMAWHAGALYLSDAVRVNGTLTFQIDRWSDFTGSNFTQRQTLWTAPQAFQGFDGIAFGPDGRLYVGVNAGLLNNNDYGPASLSPYLYDILSMNAQGDDRQVFASGIRQPWQMAFAPGSRSPFVSDLGQDGPPSVLKRNPPDFLLRVSKGQDYDFPHCNWTKGSDCTGAARPYRFFSAHSDPMGLAILGHSLYIGSFVGMGLGRGGALYAMRLGQKSITPLVTSFPAATDALGAHGGALYVGGTSSSGKGLIYKVVPHRG